MGLGGEVLHFGGIWSGLLEFHLTRGYTGGDRFEGTLMRIHKDLADTIGNTPLLKLKRASS